MKIFGKLLVYGGLVVATLISVYSCVLFPDYKLDTDDILAALEKGAASPELSKEKVKDFTQNMELIRGNDRTLHEWGAERGELHVYLYLIYLVTTIVLLGTVRKKDTLIKDLERSPD